MKAVHFASDTVGNSSSPYLCASPLVHTSKDVFTTLWALEDIGCAVPCPTVTFTDEEWNSVENLVKLLTVISLVSSFTMFISHIFQAHKYRNRLMFIFGFLVSAIVLCSFFYYNRGNELVCHGRAHYHKREGLCIAQAAVTIWSFIWVEIWSVILAFDAYAHITSSISKDNIPVLRRRYFVTAIILSVGITIIPLAGDNLGFDPEANIPLCLFLISETMDYFWFTLYLPFGLFSVSCLIITVMAAYKLQKIFVMSNKLLRKTLPPTAFYTEEIVGRQSADTSPKTSEMVKSPLTTTQSFSRPPAESFSIESRTSNDEQFFTPFSRMLTFNRSSVGTSSSWNTQNWFHSSSDTAPHRSRTHTSPTPPTNAAVIASEVPTWARASVDQLAYEESVDVSTDSVLRTHTDFVKSFFVETWKYNGPSILFIVVFCFTSMLILPLLIDLYYLRFDAFKDSTEDYVACLVGVSVTHPYTNQTTLDDIARSVCGRHPSHRPGLAEVELMLGWAAAYGIVPSVLFFSVRDTRRFCKKLLFGYDSSVSQ